MKTAQWLKKVSGGTSVSAIATRAGYPASTLTRQIKRGQLSSDVVIQIARSYRTSILEGLIACGHITEDEAGLKARANIAEALEDATDRQLIEELLRRVVDDDGLGHPDLRTDIDVDEYIQPFSRVAPPVAAVSEPPSAHDYSCANDSEVIVLPNGRRVTRADIDRAAALDVGYAPEMEWDQPPVSEEDYSQDFDDYL
ncbi:hypothetical protein [Schaalia sp. lx-260]|uniref:hypothetical protein n=1 Tax=Schaalia sp. lx-260 TaxID=2899082 RepID=UPI001E2BFF9D|nr:hypothetical protein [Schaalia sp. lx-260]MCD4549703.1 hypothetical protein [Schaalia sp. lx-260]